MARSMRTFLSVTVSACTFWGCVLGPDYERPQVEEPAAFRMQQETETEGKSLADLRWWELFKDSHLQALIRYAQLENKDIRLAVARIREAHAQFGVTGADRFPQVDGNASAQRNQTSGAAARRFGISREGQEGPTTNQFIATFDLSFELDLWGKFRRASEAAQAELVEQEWASRTVFLTLVSDIAQAYFELQELDLELEIAKLTHRTREETLELIRLRKLMGQSSTLDVRRAEQEVARAQAVIPDLERQIGQKENQLSILVGKNPDVVIRTSGLEGQTFPPDVPAGLPSALLARRPDIQEAEQRLIAANAQIGVAKAAFFPQISLTGNYGAQSLEFSDLFIGTSQIWSFGPSVTVPIFQGGRNRANLEVAKARHDQAVISYEQAIQQAFREVEDALVAHQKTREIRKAQEELVRVSREALKLAQLEYLNGQANYLAVLDTQRQLFDAEIAFAQTQRNQLLAVVQVYKAIGGGWDISPHAQVSPPQETDL
ncbi:MAG: RND transporter [Nitrospirales bacterium]|nr:MAG: RND transporter [Nitrospirales bacterium]